MTVKEFVNVISYAVIDYAKIYELHWNTLYEGYDYKFTDKRVETLKDLEPYYNCELSSLEYIAPWGEYDDSAIYIKMPKGELNENREDER